MYAVRNVSFNMHNREDRWEGQVERVGNLSYGVFDVFVYIKRRLERDLGITQEQNLAGRLSACHNA